MLFPTFMELNVLVREEENKVRKGNIWNVRKTKAEAGSEVRQVPL